MGQLYLIKSKAGYDKSKLLISDDDKVLFIEEATYLFYESPTLVENTDKHFFLKEDLLLRGLIEPHQISNYKNIIDYIGMVKLVKETKKTITWF